MKRKLNIEHIRTPRDKFPPSLDAVFKDPNGLTPRQVKEKFVRDNPELFRVRGLLFTNKQALQALKDFAGITISEERLRQLRIGDKATRKRKDGSTWYYHTQPKLIRGLHWIYQKGIRYRLRGIKELFRIYGAVLEPSAIGKMRRWLQKSEFDRPLWAPKSQPKKEKKP